MLENTGKDELTGLANKNQLASVFNRFVKNNAIKYNSFYLLVLNLDSFKNINCKYGFQSGDLVLTSFARMLADCIRFNAQIFRYDKDKFTIILSDTEKSFVVEMIEQIQTAIKQNSLLTEFDVSCSIGCANYIGDDNLNTLFKRAEDSLYRNKEKSKQCNQFQQYEELSFI